jgi:Arc/MetJ-type ribon-helix-helix transcriptional regulator
MKEVRARIPNEMYEQLETLIKQGWFPSREYVLKLALRKFLYSHRPEVLEKQIRDDVEWGLRGNT